MPYNKFQEMGKELGRNFEKKHVKEFISFIEFK